MVLRECAFLLLLLMLTFGESAGPFAVILTDSYGLTFYHVAAMTVELNDFARLVSAAALNVAVIRTDWRFAHHL